MKKIWMISVFAVGLCQAVWADGFEVDGMSDEASYEGSVFVAQSIEEAQEIQKAQSVQEAQSDVGVLSAEFSIAVNANDDSVGVSDRFSSPIPFVFFNTELEGVVGEEVSHRWFHNGQLVLEEGFVIDKAKFSAISKKNMELKNVGEWRVEVRQQETLLEEKTFTYLAGI